MTAARTPTAEQAEIIQAAPEGKGLVIEAGAGTGKTTTLKMLAAAMPGRGLYVAYNRAIATDARRSFPSGVECSTAHGLAYRAGGYQYKERLDGPRIPARESAKILGINEPLGLAEKVLAPAQVARLAMETVGRFCRSADPEPDERHVPRKPGLDSPEDMAVLRQVLVPLARKAWADLTSSGGRLRFDHDCYLKMWQLSGPKIPADYIMLDEAQDANPVILSVVTSQENAQLIAVGDRSQAIYGWTGAVDAMDRFPAARRLMLSESFRFGPAIAGEANKWLAVLHAPMRLTGAGSSASAVRSLGLADAVLCRTNAGAIDQAMRSIDAGNDTAVVGGGKEIRSLAEAAITLKAGKGTSHPQLFAFNSWGEVQDYADNDPGGSDLKAFVDLIDRNGPESLITVVDRLVPESRARVTVSTAHKAKGREWDTVRIAPGGFREPKPFDDGSPGTVGREDAMLAYVAVTRARTVLDREGLAWVDSYVPGRDA